MSKTPWEVVLEHYDFPTEINGNPFIPEPLQIETINERAESLNSGVWLDMGTGKTFVSTACALYQFITGNGPCFVIMPPLLIRQWGRWLRLIKHKSDQVPLSVTEYAGAPKKREKLSLFADFVLVGIQIFKRDYGRFTEHCHNRPYTVIVDEATFCANINSDNHEAVFEFTLGRPRQLLSGTPANAPGDAYGLITFTAPGTYRNLKSFQNIHVEETDFFDAPSKWKNLELLNSNLLINGKRVLYEDMYKDVEKPIYDLIYYDLADNHQKLYRKLAEEELLKLPDGGKIDATTANKLRHALGQIIVNFGHFAGSPDSISASVQMVQEKLFALKGGKLVVFAHYRMSVKLLVEKLKRYGAVAINSEVSAAQKDRNLRSFTMDPACMVIVIQYVSGGKGLDGLQHVSHTALCIEPCQQPRDFHQAIARLKRRGQRKKVHVMLPVARGTLQMKAFRNLVINDDLVNQVVRNSVSLRKEIFGEDAEEISFRDMDDTTVEEEVLPS